MEESSSRTVLAVVALGSNIEPRAERLEQALRALAELPGTRLVRASSTLDNAGVDVPPEFAHLRFLNQVAAFETSLEVHDFARRMHAIEDAQGEFDKKEQAKQLLAVTGRYLPVILKERFGNTLGSKEIKITEPEEAQRY